MTNTGSLSCLSRPTVFNSRLRLPRENPVIFPRLAGALASWILTNGALSSHKAPSGLAVNRHGSTYGLLCAIDKPADNYVC